MATAWNRPPGGNAASPSMAVPGAVPEPPPDPAPGAPPESARHAGDGARPARGDPPGPPLHAALDYCARRLLAALDAGDDRSAGHAHDAAPLAALLTPATRSLLRWWFSADACRARVDNFHFAQREAIVHTIVAHELLRCDAPALLHQRACGPPTDAPAAIADDARHVLRMAPGGGARWVAQALLVWWWANAADAANAGSGDGDGDDGDGDRDGVDGDRADGDGGASLQLVVATPGIRRRLRLALFGLANTEDGEPRRAPDPDRGSLFRHARLFLPPALRAPFRAWLRAQSRHGDAPPEDAPLRIVEARECPVETSAMTLVATTGARMAGIAGAGIGPSRPGPRLRIDLMLAGEPGAAIVDAPLQRMIRRGAAKLPMLEATHAVRVPPLREKPQPHPGLRPRLCRAHAALLRLGIDALRRRDPGFAMLDPARRPRLSVLCDAPTTLRAARSFLARNGFAPDTIAIGGDHACRDRVRAVLEALPPHSTLADARICVIVVLRARHGGVGPLDVAAAGAAPLWPEPEFAEIRGENRERAARGLAPRNLVDVLSVIEHPQCHAAYAPLLGAGLVAPGVAIDAAARRAGDAGPSGGAGDRGLAGPPGDRASGGLAPVGSAFSDGPASDDPALGDAFIDDPAIGDLMVVALRDRAPAFDFALPIACDDGLRRPERLRDLPRRMMRRRHAVPVRKSVYSHDGCGDHDNGLWRAFLACAESDPEIESHALIDPRRHGTASREAWLARGFATRAWPDALVRTATRVYLVNFQPYCPTRPWPPDAAERRLAHWLRRANALPSPRRAGRVWCRATLAAPLFWSWKRNGGALSALLSASADAMPPAPRGDFVP